MFTGIVEELGTIQHIARGQHSAVLTIQAKTVLEHTKLGDSIAVNGICLTVTKLASDRFSADVMHETLNRSALAQLSVGSPVNLERAMAADGRFGGHIVAGHVDGVGRITNIRRDDNAIWYTVQTQPALLRYVVEQARQQGRKGLVLTCKEHLLHFYGKVGFVDEGISDSTHGGAVWHKMRLTF